MKDAFYVRPYFGYLIYLRSVFVPRRRVPLQFHSSNSLQNASAISASSKCETTVKNVAVTIFYLIFCSFSKELSLYNTKAPLTYISYTIKQQKN